MCSFQRRVQILYWITQGTEWQYESSKTLSSQNLILSRSFKIYTKIYTLKDHSTSDMQKQKQQQPCFMSSLGKGVKYHFISTKKGLQREQWANLECGLTANEGSLKNTMGTRLGGRVTVKGQSFTFLKTLMLTFINFIKVAFKIHTIY